VTPVTIKSTVQARYLTSPQDDIYTGCNTAKVLLYYLFYLTTRGSRFLEFLDFRSLTTEFILAQNSTTKVGNAFFFIIMSSYAEMRLLEPKKGMKSLNLVKKYFFLQIGRYGYQKSKILR
jgi:hypothetical protein